METETRAAAETGTGTEAEVKAAAEAGTDIRAETQVEIGIGTEPGSVAAAGSGTAAGTEAGTGNEPVTGGSVFTGGCQCGAIRFRLEGRPKDVSICHCRMCQKAFGGYYAPLVSARGLDLTWTRGKLKYFASSNHVRRGFCENCGTPMTYKAEDGIAIAAGAFDTPSALPPVIQFGTEAKIGFVDHLHQLPARQTMDDINSAPFLADIRSYQHPDHDTQNWETGSWPPTVHNEAAKEDD